MHVVRINWDNDAINSRRILKEGLEILLDAEPDQHYPETAETDQHYPEAMAEDSVIVMLEVHLPGRAEGIFIVDGICEMKENKISWHWDWEDKEGVVAKIFEEIDEASHKIFRTPRHFIRVRVTVKGHTIWSTVNGRRIYLDGQVFGVLGGGRANQGRRRMRIDLGLPSGAGAKASDFESWFYIKE